MQYTLIYIGVYIYLRGRYTCVGDGYWSARGCIASHAHVHAIALADDAAVAIMCARGYVRRYI